MKQVSGNNYYGKATTMKAMIRLAAKTTSTQATIRLQVSLRMT